MGTRTVPVPAGGGEISAVKSPKKKKKAHAPWVVDRCVCVSSRGAVRIRAVGWIPSRIESGWGFVISFGR